MVVEQEREKGLWLVVNLIGGWFHNANLIANFVPEFITQFENDIPYENLGNILSDPFAKW